MVLESVYIANRTSHSSLGEITPYSNNKSASILSAEHYSTRSTKGRRCSKGPMKKRVSMQLLPGPGVFTIRRQKNRSKLGTPVYQMHRRAATDTGTPIHYSMVDPGVELNPG